MNTFTRAFTLVLLAGPVVVMGSAAGVARADTIYVCWDGSGDYLTIQEGIDAAEDGDEVVACNGVYTGVGNKNLDFGGKLITVRSASGDPNTCIIDCQGDGRGFYFHSGETAQAVVQGLTICNGYVDGTYPGMYGGGVCCRDNSSPTLTNCTISQNTTDGLGGGGVFCWYSSPALANCTITGNLAQSSGGGIFCWYSSPALANCTIAGNTAGGPHGSGGGVSCWYSSPTLTNCAINRNTAGCGYGGGGGGVICQHDSSPTLANCSILQNIADDYGGGLDCRTGSSPTLLNCMVWGNYPQAIYGSGPVVTYSDIQGGWEGEGNIDADPLVTPDGHLTDGSPCFNAGDPDGDYEAQTDMDGEPRVIDGRVDIGADEWLDSDTDGLPDWWEEFHFGDPLIADPLGDEDGDGLTNLAEYQAGRDPWRPPRTYYVDLAGNDDWDGLAPEWDGEHGPKATIQAAIDACDPYEVDEVVIADGTYTGDGNRDLDIGGKVVTVRSEFGPDNCIIDCEGDGRGFYFHSRETAQAVVQGLTICNGYVDDSYPGEYGGGVYCYLSSPTLANCTITQNTAYRGGGVSCGADSSPTLTNCTISQNSATGGGGVSCGTDASPTLNDCMITQNSSGGGGGGVYCRKGNPTLTNCAVTGNTASDGGGVYCFHGSLTLTNCSVVGNTASGSGNDEGGGVCCYLSSSMLVNCTISDNSAEYGGAICCEHLCSSALVNCTITGNTAASGAALACISASPAWASDVLIINCVLWNGGGEVWNNDDSTITITYSDVFGGWEGEGNIAADPLFVDPDGADDDPNTWEDNNYRLSVGSPCIDAADNEAVPADRLDMDEDGDTDEPIPFDLDGNPRFVDDPATEDTGNGAPPIVDMGAYEFQVTELAAFLDIKPGSCPNPLNRNSQGVLPVALVGTEDFDVTQVDLDSLELMRADGIGGSVTPLMGPPGPGIRVEDVATPFEGEPCDCHELQGDGIADLAMKFDTPETVAVLQLDDFPGGASVELILSGELLDTTHFSATDCVILVPPGSGPGALPAQAGPEGNGIDAVPEPAPAVRPDNPDGAQNDGTPGELSPPPVGCGVLPPGFLLAATATMYLISRARPVARQRE